MLKIRSALDSERLDHVEHDLRDTGFHIIENVITPEEADAAREAVWKLVKEDIANGDDHSYGDGKIRRVWAIVGKAPVFRRLIQHPTVVAVWKRMLGEDVIASTFTANIVGPDARLQAVGISTTRIGRCKLPFHRVHSPDRRSGC